MAASTFVYVTYIRTTPETLWEALTSAEWTRKYWMGTHQETDWQPGSPWKLMHGDGRVADAGEVVEAEPGKRLVLRWRNEGKAELKAEGYTRCTIELEPQGPAVKLTVTHTMDRENSQFIQAVGRGWPQILSNLKSLLETGSIVLAA